MDIDLIKKQIQYARDNRTGVVLKGLFKDTPGWDQFINHLSSEYNKIDNNYDLLSAKEYYNEKFVNGVTLYGDQLYASARLFGLNYFPQAQPVLDFFKEIIEDPEANFVQTFMNFVKNDNQIKMHIDQRETVFWLCQGSVTWVLANPDNWDEVTKFDLEAGDIMFAAFGLPHTVETKAPRAGMVLSAFNQWGK